MTARDKWKHDWRQMRLFRKELQKSVFNALTERKAVQRSDGAISVIADALRTTIEGLFDGESIVSRNVVFNGKQDNLIYLPGWLGKNFKGSYR